MHKENSRLLEEIDPALFEVHNSVKKTELQDVTVFTSVNQMPTLQFIKDGRSMYLHSRYNPAQEAEKIINNLVDIDQYNYILFYGIGLGYHVEEVLKKHPDKKIALIEPSVEVFKAFVEQRSLEFIIGHQITYFKVGLSKEDTELFIDEYFNIIQEKTLLITLPSYERYMPEQSKDFITKFKQTVKEKRQGMLVNYSFQKRWTLNSLLNLPTTISTRNILHDFNSDVFKNKPAIIVAAGPSLNYELEHLRYIKEHGLAYIFSVGSAINTLVENDIFPDAMCTYDPTSVNQKVFEKVISANIENIPMVYGTSVGYETLKSYQGPKLHMITSQDTVTNYYLKKKNNEAVDKVNDAPSIAVVTLELLYKLKCSPIILVGQNLAYKDKQRYSKDMGYQHITSTITDEELLSAQKVKSVDGNEVYTNESFNRMRNQIEFYLSHALQGVEVINTTRGGAFIEGTTFKELPDVMTIIEQNGHNQIRKDWYLEEKTSYELSDIKDRKETMDKSLLELHHLLSVLNKRFNKMEKLISERKMAKLEVQLSKFDNEMKNFINNDFYKVFLQPMSRVEFDVLTKKVNSLKFDKNMISKSKKMIDSFKMFIKSCEFDLDNMNKAFEEVNVEIEKLIIDIE